MSELTATWGNVTLTAHPQTGRDYLLLQTIYGKLGIDADTPIEEFTMARTYARAVTQSEAVGLDFTLPNPAAAAEEHRAGLERFLSVPGELMAAWLRLINTADEPPNDPVLLPGSEVAQEALNDPLSGSVEERSASA